MTEKNGIFQWVGSNTKSSSRNLPTIIRDSGYQLNFFLFVFSMLSSSFDEKMDKFLKNNLQVNKLGHSKGLLTADQMWASV